MLTEKMNFVDQIEVLHYRNGELIDRRVTAKKSPLWSIAVKILRLFGVKKYADDLVTNDGKAAIANLLTTNFGYVAIGSDDGTTLALDATNTTLGSEVNRVAATTSLETTNVTNDTAVFQATFDFTAATTVTESGVFDAATAGTMLCRQTFPALNMQAGDSLVVTWKIVCQ